MTVTNGIIIHRISATVRPTRLLPIERPRALGLAEIPWVAVSFVDRDLLFRDREVVVGSGVNAVSGHPDGIVPEV